jgi:hypothetical protein
MKRSFLFLAAGLGFASVLWAPKASARLFTNAYVSFELPDSWNCVLEQTEWVCRPAAPDIQQLGIIILTAKEVGPSDSLALYKGHLQQPRVIASRTGQPLNSTVYKVEDRQINGQPWVDGMHSSSEVPNFYTRYLATTKDKIAVLVTFSAHTQHYTKFQTAFLAAIASLRVTATKSLMSGKGEGAGGGSGMFGAGGNMGLGGLDGIPEEEQAGEGSGGFGDKAKSILAIAVILGGIGIYLMIKRRRR